MYPPTRILHSIVRVPLLLALTMGLAGTEALAFGGKNKDKRTRERVTAPAEDAEQTPAEASEDSEALDALLDQLIEATDDTKAASDIPAEELPDDEGIWAWVERMDDEIPSDEQVEAIREKSEEENDQRVLMEGAGAESDETVYEDPEKSVSDPLHLDKVDPSEFDIPMVVNDDVRKWVAYFSGPRGRKYFQRWLDRSGRFVPMMHTELEKAGLPKDLIYLSMIESGFNTQAYSHAHAAGLWQFIPSTARLYKVRVDWWVDDRRDPGVATAAGIAYLTELNRMFGDWYLAWASYNGGPGRVRRAISQSGSRDFWTLAHGTYLHTETDNYVPKILAAAIIGKHPERYGFTVKKDTPPLTYDTVRVDGSVDLGVLATCAGIKTSELQALNPALRRWATPPEGYDMRVPKGKGKTFASALANVPKSKRVTFSKHKVARGDTLSGIATKYGVTTHDLVRANRLANANRIYVGMSLVVPVGGGAVPATSQGRSSSASSTKAPSRPSSHTVRKGDTLSTIASRYHVSVSQVRSWNGLRGDTIYVGQKLKLGGGASTGASSPTRQTVSYTIRNGDNLSKIAAKYGVTVSDLQRWNKISNASKILVGQKITVHLASTSWRTYTVRSGDSLGRIAERNGCTIRQIQDWNKLSGTVIHPGQKLKIKG